jgi:membrane-associated phospholipid phosphatase
LSHKAAAVVRVPLCAAAAPVIFATLPRPTVLALAFSVALSTTRAGAQKRIPEPERPADRAASISPDKPVRWDPRWQRFELANYITTAGYLAVGLASLAIPPDEGLWSGPNSFDQDVRSALRLTRTGDQFIARDASDVLLALSFNQVLVDSLIVTWWGHDNGEAAYQMALISAEAVAFNVAIQSLVTSLSSRQRPYAVPTDGSPSEGNRCVGEANETLEDCRGTKRYRSFFSGHTSTTFTIAGVTCMHHAYMPLYGGGAPDALACVAGFAVAAGTGVLRIVSEQHWLTDVLAGAGMGTAVGLALPWLLHYRTGDLPDEESSGIQWTVVPMPTGAAITGVY